MANLASPVGAGRIQLIGRFSNTSDNTTFIPDAIIANKEIGPGPKLVYSRLLSYAAANEAVNRRLRRPVKGEALRAARSARP
jgi:hypothetical protein